MATTINEIRTQFTTQGAGKVAKDTEQVTKAQTRLGQASAASGRQFSSQAQGLGGLVGAYAGAAATVFALQQAFSALNRAARAEQTITGVNALANAVGESGPKILKNIQEITKGQLSLVQSAELANLALSSGLGGNQISDLTSIALKASRALGRDLTDSLNRLIKGVAKLEPELLDELGIFVRIEPAAEAYAASIGKVASQLSNFEKRQAFAVAVAAEGNDKFKDIDTTANTSAQSLEKLVATLSDLGTEVGAFIANALQPLVEALSAPGAAIGAFGILTKTIFGKAITEASGALQNFSTKSVEVGDNLRDFLGGGTKAAAQANINFAESLAEVNVGLFANTTANEKRLRELTKEGRVNVLRTGQLKEYKSLLEQEIATTKNKIALLQSLTRRTEAQNKALISLTNRQREYNAALTATNARLDSSGVISKAAGNGIAAIGQAFSKAAGFALGLLSKITTFITIASILITVGAQIAEAFGWTETLSKFIGDVVYQVERLLGITKELRDQNKVNKGSGLADVFTKDENIKLGQFNSGKRGTLLDWNLERSGEDINAAILDAMNKGKSGEDLENYVKRRLFGGAANAKLVTLTPEFSAALKKAGERIAERVGTGYTEGITSFAEATGRTLTTVINQLESQKGALKFKGASGAAIRFENAGSARNNAERKAIKERNTALSVGIQIQELEVKLQEKLNSGAATSESIEKSLGALANRKRALLQEQAVLGEVINGESKKEREQREKLLEINKQNLAQVDKAVKATESQADRQLTILRARKQIVETFKSEIAAAEKIKDSFILQKDGSMKLATSESDRRKAQSAFLQKSLELGGKYLTQQRAGVKISSDEAQLAALARDAQAASLGVFMKAVEEAKKLVQELDKQEKQLKAQKKTLDLQIDLQKILNDERTLKTQKEIADIRLNSAKATLETEIKLAKVKEDSAKIDRSASAERAKNIAAEFGDLISPQKQRALELRLAQTDLEALKESINQQKINAEKLAKIEVDKVSAQNALLAAQIGIDDFDDVQGTIQKRVEAEAKLAEQKIKADAEARKAEIKIAKERNAGIQTELTGFNKHVEGIAQVLAADLVERKAFALSGTTGGLERAARDAAEANKDLLKKPGLKEIDINKLSPDQARRILYEEQLAKTTPEVSAELQALASKLKINESRFTDLTKQIDANTQAQLELDSLKRQRAADAEIAKAQAQLAAGEQQLINIRKDLEAKTGSLNNELKQGQAAIDTLREKHKMANDVFLQVAKEIATNISERFAQGLRDLNTAIQEGTLTMDNFKQGVKDMFVDMLKSVQQTIFEKTVVQPAKQFVSDTVLSALGIEPDKKIENALVKVGGITAMRVVAVGGNLGTSTAKSAFMQGTNIPSLFPNGVGQSMEEDGIDEGLFESAVSSGTDLTAANTALQQSTTGLRSTFQQMELSANPLTSLFGKVAGGLTDFGSSLFSMVGSLFGSFGGGGQAGSGIFGLIGTIGRGIVSGFSSLFTPSAVVTSATGGSVRQMAAGGMLRDRVPTLLEPGEFVIRKPMAKAIGGPALNAMNGTGAMPGGNVVVNIENRGTPQDAEAKQPRFDGEKFVIDIVTRDLRNNGPIRKSMRGDR